MSPSKRLIFLLLKVLGINALFRVLNRNKAIILWYHGISDDDFTLLKGYDERHIPKSLFAKQLRFLKDRGYRFATMTELMDLLEQRQQPQRRVVLTFDDGFRNVVENAYPVMKEWGARGCFYLVSSLINTDRLLWTDHVETVVRNAPSAEFRFAFNGETISYQLNTKEARQHAMKDIKRQLRTLSDTDRKAHLAQFKREDMGPVPREFLFSTWDQIKSLDRVLEAGCHTRNHPNCANLHSATEFQEELGDSKSDIEGKIGYPIRHFCYPAGSFNDEVITNVRKQGYRSATTIIPGFNDLDTDVYQLRRISVEEDFLFFQALTSGSYFFISRLFQAIKGSR